MPAVAIFSMCNCIAHSSLDLTYPHPSSTHATVLCLTHTTPATAIFILRVQPPGVIASVRVPLAPAYSIWHCSYDSNNTSFADMTFVPHMHYDPAHAHMPVLVGHGRVSIEPTFVMCVIC